MNSPSICRFSGFTQQQRAVQDSSDSDVGHTGHRRTLPSVSQSGATPAGLPQGEVTHSCVCSIFVRVSRSSVTHLPSLPVVVRTHLQIDGPYDEAFLEKLQKCPAEDDGSVEYAVAKVSGPVPNSPQSNGCTEKQKLASCCLCGGFLL